MTGAAVRNPFFMSNSMSPKMPILDNKCPASFMTEECIFLNIQSDNEAMPIMKSNKDEDEQWPSDLAVNVVKSKRKRKRRRKKKKKSCNTEISQPDMASVKMNEIPVPDLGKEKDQSTDNEFNFASKFFLKPLDEELSGTDFDWDELTDSDTNTSSHNDWDEVFEMEFGTTGLFQSQLFSSSLQFVNGKFNDITISEYSEVEVQIKSRLLQSTAKKVHLANEKWNRIPSGCVKDDNSKKAKVCLNLIESNSNSNPFFLVFSSYRNVFSLPKSRKFLYLKEILLVID